MISLNWRCITIKTKNKRKINNKKKIFSKIYLLIFALITITFITFLKVIDILPNIYFILISIIAIIVFFLVFILLKKKGKKVGYIISTIFIIIYLTLLFYLGTTINFFSYFNKDNYSEEKYLVIVLNTSNYNELNDLNNKIIGYTSNDLTMANKALNNLNKKIDTKNKSYDKDKELFKNLEDNSIDGILINEAYYNIKKEEENTDNYKIIYTLTVRSFITKTSKEVDITKDPFTIYISGIDVYGNIETVSRSDVNILMTVNPQTKQILLTSIPRDYYVQLSKTTGYKDKLTHAGNYGVNMSIDTIEQLLNININYYIRVNFKTLEKLIDALEGVDVYSKYQFISYIDNYKFYEGYNHMNGKEALAFSRERKSLPNGDIDRGKNQEAVIEAIIRKATSSDIIYKYTKILNSLKGTFQTNIQDTDITKLIKKELQNIGNWTVTSISLNGTGEYNYTYSYSSQKLYVLVPDENSINEAVNMIKSVIEGNKLNSSYSQNPSNIKNPSKIEPEIPKEDTTPKSDNNSDKIDVDDNTNNNEDNSNNPLDDLLPDNKENESNKDNENNNEDNNENDDNNIKDLLPKDEENNN